MVITIDQERYALIGKTVNEYADKVFKYSPQMFYIKNENEPIRPIALATCVLYENDNDYYLITASHVFENSDIDPKKIGILINDYFCILHGILVYTDNKISKVDLAIMKLADHFVKDILEQYSFLHDDLINTNHELTMSQQYLMAGFPVSKTKIYGETHEREELVALTKPSQEKEYKSIGFNEDHHIIVDVDKAKDFFNIKPTAKLPHLYGVSGSGLWFISDRFSPSRVSLVAIMTEWHKVNKVSVGTKIDVAINIIKCQF